MTTFEPAGFFVLRTPLLPFDEFLDWSRDLAAPAALSSPPHEPAAQLEAALYSDRRRLRARLRAVVARPEVRAALFLASPSLDDSLHLWFSTPDSERGRKIELTLVRYLARMAGRATPFGLFAGCSFGRVGAATRLELSARACYGRHTRLDMEYVSALTDALCCCPGVQAHLTLRPNSSLYRAGDRLRYAEGRFDGEVRTYHLVSLEPTTEIDAVLARAEQGARSTELQKMLLELHPQLARKEAERFIGELIGNQVLVADLAPAVSGSDPVHKIIADLGALQESSEAHLAGACLAGVESALAELDRRPLGTGDPPYRAIADTLRELPAKVELPRLFQVDMIKPAPELSLGPKVLEDLARAVTRMRHLVAAPEGDVLQRFSEAFRRRWGDREIPLVEALDEESGVGFSGGETKFAEPLLRGLAFPPPPPADPMAGASFVHLLRRLEENRGARELVLDDADFEALAVKDPPALPDAFAVSAIIAAASNEAIERGDYRLHLHGAFGPSGANLLGRFCHALPELEEAVKSYLHAEEALRPQAIYAEVVHLPAGRIGNVLLRPVLRAHEITFLGVSGAPREGHILITDLLVSVEGARVVLRSRRLGREVIPRLTSAHNYNLRSLGVYRFLCSLQEQGVTNVDWNWGALDAAEFLPRVVSGNVVLAPARWRLAKKRLSALSGQKGEQLYRAVQALRAELGLPRHVVLADGNHLLILDLDNTLSVDSFAQLVKERPEAILRELAPAPEDLCARGPEGRYAHELLIPFLRRGAPSVDSAVPAALPVPDAGRRTFAPGSEWLTVKLYAGVATVDGALAAAVPVIRSALASGASDGWFFIRYGDPEWHLRLRFHGNPQRLCAEVLPALHAAMERLLADGRVWKMQLDTYVRELERYGGAEGTLICERIFQADSEAALSIASTLSGDGDASTRWRSVVLGIERLFEDFAFYLPSRRVIVQHLRTTCAEELRSDMHLKRQLGAKYRREHSSLEALLAPDADSRPHRILAERTRAIAPLIAELRAGGADLERILASLIHMHTNRLLRSAGRAQELVIYDLLARFYESREARARPI